jgi:hypothetical protein
MSDTPNLTVRDHNHPCKHGWYAAHNLDESNRYECWGGREIVLRKDERWHNKLGDLHLWKRWVTEWEKVDV